MPLTDCDCEIAVAARADDESELVRRFNSTAHTTFNDLIELVPQARVAP